MNMKNTVILLIFLLSVLGLILGVYYTSDVSSDNSQDSDADSVSMDDDSDLAIATEHNENNGLDRFFT